MQVQILRVSLLQFFVFFRIELLGNTEVAYLGLAKGIDQYIPWLQVSMKLLFSHMQVIKTLKQLKY